MGILYRQLKVFSRVFKSRCAYSINTNSSKSTIFALSSGFGKCGVAVIRVSGPGTVVALKEMCGFHVPPAPREAKLRKLLDPVTKEVLDQGLVLWFPGPKSFTGEDSCEFQIHGGIAVISAVLKGLGQLENFRPAEPGEFTKRAFYSGKMDLTAVEGLSALIDSETEIQRKQAFQQMGGALHNLYSEWTNKLTKILAHLEAYIDFDEDQDIDKDTFENVNSEVIALIMAIKKHLTNGIRGERIRKGVQMTILGAPNSGKSSLMNLLCKRPAAIVSSVPGTTRDVVQTHLDISGYPVNVSDTAGLRANPVDEVEAEGMSRAISSAIASDLLLFIFDVALYAEWTKENSQDLKSPQAVQRYLEERVKDLGLEGQIEQCENLKQFFKFTSQQRTSSSTSQGILVFSKIDLLDSKEKSFFLQSYQNYSFICGVSCKTEDGVEQLVHKMTTKLEKLCGSSLSMSEPSFSMARQRHCLEECLSSLEKFNQLSSDGYQVDLTAEQLRRAIESLGRLTGRISTEQLLDVIFRDFCIGK